MTVSARSRKKKKNIEQNKNRGGTGKLLDRNGKSTGNLALPSFGESFGLAMVLAQERGRKGGD